MQPKELIKGTLQTIILKLLSEEKCMYGYEITQKVKELSEGKFLLTEGALYPTLHKLEAEGLVRTEIVHLGKRVRKYYHLTTDGANQTQAKIVEFINFIQTMNRILKLSPEILK